MSTTPERRARVLFLCTGNSARSIIAEALLRHHGGGAFDVFSAGTEPKGINPLTLRVLEEAGLGDTARAARSKSVAEFTGRQFDYVITVCDQARQACPVFPGSYRSLHWDYPDPAAAEGNEEERLAVFRSVFDGLDRQIAQFAAEALSSPPAGVAGRS